MKEIEYTILYCGRENFCDSMYYGSEIVTNYVIKLRFRFRYSTKIRFRFRNTVPMGTVYRTLTSLCETVFSVLAWDLWRLSPACWGRVKRIWRPTCPVWLRSGSASTTSTWTEGRTGSMHYHRHHWSPIKWSCQIHRHWSPIKWSCQIHRHWSPMKWSCQIHHQFIPN